MLPLRPEAGARRHVRTRRTSGNDPAEEIHGVGAPVPDRTDEGAGTVGCTFRR